MLHWTITYNDDAKLLIQFIRVHVIDCQSRCRDESIVDSISDERTAICEAIGMGRFPFIRLFRRLMLWAKTPGEVQTYLIHSTSKLTQTPTVQLQ